MEGVDKAFCMLGGRSLVDLCVERLGAQVQPLAISSNVAAASFSDVGLPVLADTVPGFLGPLAGILAGLRWAQSWNQPPSHLVSVAVDSPLFPQTLVADFEAALGDDTTIAIARSEDGRQPVFGAWPLAVADDLEACLATGGIRKVALFLERHNVVHVHFPAVAVAGAEVDPFFNINNPQDLSIAEGLVSASRFAGIAAGN